MCNPPNKAKRKKVEEKARKIKKERWAVYQQLKHQQNP
jgi:hypothetical protein